MHCHEAALPWYLRPRGLLHPDLDPSPLRTKPCAHGAGLARMPEDSEEDESFEAGSDEGDSDDESVDAEDGVTGVRPCSARWWLGYK